MSKYIAQKYYRTIRGHALEIPYTFQLDMQKIDVAQYQEVLRFDLILEDPLLLLLSNTDFVVIHRSLHRNTVKDIHLFIHRIFWPIYLATTNLKRALMDRLLTLKYVPTSESLLPALLQLDSLIRLHGDLNYEEADKFIDYLLKKLTPNQEYSKYY